MSPDSHMWQTPARQDHLTGTSQASANSRRLPKRPSQGTVRPLRVKETLGPVPTSPAGGCGARDVLLAIPGVMEGPAPKTSKWMQEAGTPQDFKSALRSARKAAGPQR